MTLNKIDRNYFFGDEWLYYKFYLGQDTSDKFLVDIIKPVSEQLLEKKIIDKWFFIRFNDPEPHLRVRFHLKQQKYISDIALIIKKEIQYYVNNNYINKIQIETYKRELERYGSLTMEECETLFFLNSSFNIKLIEKYGDGEERWLFGMKYVDKYLDDFNLSLRMKFDLIEKLKIGFAKEFNADKPIIQKLAKKFRLYKTSIQNILDGNDLFFTENYNRHSDDFEFVRQEMIGKTSQFSHNYILEDLMDSLLHMHWNRLFKTQQRAHEWLMYDFMFQYYKSKIAREKIRTGVS